MTTSSTTMTDTLNKSDECMVREKWISGIIRAWNKSKIGKIRKRKKYNRKMSFIHVAN